MSKLIQIADDHFHDHCGVFGVFGHPEAAKLTYLGLYALQHRGQESAGIASSDGMDLHLHRSLGHVQEIFTPEVIVHLIARSNARNLPGALAEALNQVEGAYSLLLLTTDEMYAIRDPRGFRPLILGRIDGAWVAGSETCAFDLIDAEYVREVEPGEMVRISRSGIESIRFAPEKPHQYCIFEHVYFSRPDSVVFGRPVNQSRERLGRLLAREHPVEADIVTPVPDSGVPAAVGYAAESGIPFRMGLIRNHYVGRTFIEPEQAIRDFGVKLKLSPVRRMLEGQRVILVDDSIVRGTTSRKIVRLVREAGATEVHVRISCPPTISPCYYGVDTPRREELIASHNSVDQIRRFLGADSLGYLSLPSLREAVEDPDGKFCTACYTGSYPTELVQLEVEAHRES